MDLRELKALEIAARCRIVYRDGVWLVPSQSGEGTYRVTLRQGDLFECQCEDFELRGPEQPCKHVIAVKLVRERDGGPTLGVLDTDAVPKRPTYKQNWPAYNLAQTTEKHRLQVLLADLCAGVPEPERVGIGRPPIPTADRLFAVAFKVYCGLSSRRSVCDLTDAFDRGYLTRPLHPAKVCSFFTQPELTEPLRALVERSALPLRAVETDFAVDSSGFSASKFVRWHDEKYGAERSGRDWVKVHICCGVKTNVVTAVEIKGRDAGDCPLLPDLVTTTAKNFKIGEVSADKAYLSQVNIETVAFLGGTPFIAPKSNTSGRCGGLFERMYHYYCFNRDEFLRHYHKRSNVESTLSAIKRKFGDSVRSRRPVAMVNEALCKILLHNLTCVIASQIELGIDATFWPDDGAPRDVLPLARRTART